MAAASLVRLSYALGLLLAPDMMSARRLAAATRGNAYATMTTRAYGAVHTNLSLLTLRAAALDRDTSVAVALNLGCDAGDLVATFLEWRGGELPTLAAIGSAALNGGGVGIWTALLGGG
jgi:hypothetical protein